jgi:hypothetical protein
MKFLIKIYLDELNSYDVQQLLDVINRSISKKDTTKIYLTSNDINFDFENIDYNFLGKISTPQMINYKLNELEWDIVLPIIRPCLFTYGFDSYINKKYKESFLDLDGVLWLDDGEKFKYPVVGRKYYQKFGYLYNPAYNKKNFEEEFEDILKINNKYINSDKILIKTITLKSEDDNIYELRKKFNFGIA